MKSLSISFTLGKGYAPHGSNIQHNNRKFTAANVDETRIASNIIYKQQYIEDPPKGKHRSTARKTPIRIRKAVIR